LACGGWEDRRDAGSPGTSNRNSQVLIIPDQHAWVLIEVSFETDLLTNVTEQFSDIHNVILVGIGMTP
jgi:hypothetical protein